MIAISTPGRIKITNAEAMISAGAAVVTHFLWKADFAHKMLEACATFDASQPFVLQLGIPWRI
jgi:hypothetical protein